MMLQTLLVVVAVVAVVVGCRLLQILLVVDW